MISSGKKILRLICDSCTNPENSLKNNVKTWLSKELEDGQQRYSTFLHSQSAHSALKVEAVAPAFDKDTTLVPGREILRDNFDKLFESNPLIVSLAKMWAK
jgi:2-oxoisovalerate dehydrogenase E1 component